MAGRRRSTDGRVARRTASRAAVRPRTGRRIWRRPGPPASGPRAERGHPGRAAGAGMEEWGSLAVVATVARCSPVSAGILPPATGSSKMGDPSIAVPLLMLALALLAAPLATEARPGKDALGCAMYPATVSADGRWSYLRGLPQQVGSARLCGRIGRPSRSSPDGQRASAGAWRASLPARPSVDRRHRSAGVQRMLAAENSGANSIVVGSRC